MGLDPISVGPIAPVAPVAPKPAVTPAEAPVATPTAPQFEDPGFSPTGEGAREDYGAMPWDAAPQLAPEAEGALQLLEADGRLDASRNGAPSLRDSVSSFLDSGGDPEVAGEVLIQLACPENIAQVAGKNTCTAAAVQASIAETDPARYFQLATQLYVDGRASLPDGTSLAVSAANRDAVAALPGDLCQKISGSFQAALMDHANGDRDYNFASDRSAGLDGETRGLDQGQFDKLNRDLLGAAVFSTESASIMAIKKSTMMRDVEDVVEDDRPTPASTALELRNTVKAAQEAGHEVLVTLKGQQGAYHVVHLKAVEGNDVRVEDPRTGLTETINITTFVRRVGDPWRPGTFVGEGGGSATTANGSRLRTPPPPAPRTLSGQ